MPNIHAPLPETEENISRPIIMEIVRQVQTITGLSSTHIYYLGGDRAQTSGGSIDSKTEGFVETSSKRMNTIEVDEQLDPEEMSPTFFNGKEYTPTFKDTAIGVILSPVYAKHNVTVRFNYKCNGRNEALRWLQDMRMKLSRLRDINIHTVEYHYNLREDFIGILKTIHKLRETQAPYGDTFEEYLAKNAISRMTRVGNLAGDQAIYAIAERQTEIYGQFDFEGLPEKPQKETEDGMWLISFAYKFNYDKPVGCHLKYPIIVHNLPMPEDLVDFTIQETRPIARAPTDRSVSQLAFGHFRSDTAMDRMSTHDGLLCIPAFDDFIPSHLLAQSLGVIQILAAIEPNDKRSLFNLEDLGDIVLDDDILAFFKEVEWNYLCSPYKSMFHLSLYQNNVLQHFDRLSIDSDLNVKAVNDLDLRKQYRVRLSMITQTDMLTQDAVSRLRLRPRVLFKTIQAINTAFRENPEMVKLDKSDPMSVLQFNALYRGLLNKEPRHYASETVGWDVEDAFRQSGISRDLLHRISTVCKTERRTQITGVLAYRKGDAALQGAKAGNITVPRSTL